MDDLDHRRPWFVLLLLLLFGVGEEEFSQLLGEEDGGGARASACEEHPEHAIAAAATAAVAATTAVATAIVIGTATTRRRGVRQWGSQQQTIEPPVKDVREDVGQLRWADEATATPGAGAVERARWEAESGLGGREGECLVQAAHGALQVLLRDVAVLLRGAGGRNGDGEGAR